MAETQTETTPALINRAATPRLTSDREIEVKQSAIGLVRSDTVTANQAAIGAVLARGDVSVAQGGGRVFVAAGDLRIHQGGGGMFLAGGSAEVSQGGVGTMVALGGVRVERGFVAVALSPRVTVAEGGRVIAGAREAAIGGAIFGAIVGGLVFLATRRQDRR